MGGTTPPVPKGLGPESSQRHLQATAFQRHLGPVGIMLTVKMLLLLLLLGLLLLLLMLLLGLLLLLLMLLLLLELLLPTLDHPAFPVPPFLYWARTFTTGTGCAPPAYRAC